MSRFLFVILIFAVILSACAPEQVPDTTTSVVTWLPEMEPENFQKADKPYPFQFPKDHGAHPAYQTEWWYFTGNLVDQTGSEFGYQLTFFRRGINSGLPENSPAFATQSIYMAHFAVTDVTKKQFRAEQRFSRDGGELANAVVDDYARIWLEDWQAEQISENQWELNAEGQEYAISLNLEDVKGIILQGKDGLSAKGPENASYYYSMTRMLTQGEIISENQVNKVTGYSWMDHEFSTSALAPDQIGWDWFSIQLDQGKEIMLFTLRKSDDPTDPYSGGVFVDESGNTTEINREDFSLEVVDTWRSPHSSAEYPAGWRLKIPDEGIYIMITPVINDQELNLAFIYWEGAVVINGEMNGSPVSGKGYVELTGYAQSMQGQF